MRAIADKLEELDHYFENKKESEKWLMIMLVAFVIGYLLYTYLFPYAKNRFKQTQVQKEQIIKKIAEERSYLNSITVNGDRNFYVKKYDREIANRKKGIKRYDDKIALLNKNFQKLSEILFNKDSWSNFLESISDRANKNEIELLSLSNTPIDQKESFGHVLEIEIRCVGRFNKMLKFVNDLEQSKLVTDVYYANTHVEQGSGEVFSDINISVWGVNH